MVRTPAPHVQNDRIVSATLHGRKQLSYYPSTGLAFIDGKGYRVTEFPIVNGRGLHFDKLDGSGGYDVELANGQEVIDDECSCPGGRSRTFCKHVAAAQVIADRITEAA